MNDASLMTEGKALAQGAGALAGLKVIDVTRVLGGPYCTMVLSDHGAEVIKLEPPQGDETREWGPPFDGWREMDSNLYGAFPVKSLFLVFAESSLFGAGRPFFVPSPGVRFAERAEGVKGPKR